MADPAEEEEVPEDQTLNYLLMLALIRHQLLLQRHATSVFIAWQQALDATEEDMVDILRSRLPSLTGLSSPLDLPRLDRVIERVRAKREAGWSRAVDEWLTAMRELAREEPRLARSIIQTLAEVDLGLALPTAAEVDGLISAMPMHGATLRQWLGSLQEQDVRRVEAAIRAGVVAGDSAQEIARRVVGSATRRGTDGVTQLTRRAAETLTRTAINHVSHLARQAFVERNRDLVERELFVATLDARTTAICRANDGGVWEVGRGPIPPLHMNCRSVRIPIIDSGFVSSRPYVASARKGALRDYAQRAGIPVPRSREDLPRGHKTTFDTFERVRKRARTGQVPSNLTYGEWLATQSAQFQDDVLGKTKGRLFRQGGLTVQQFVNKAGDELTLPELARLHAEAFREAGLDPGDFLR